MSSECDGQPSLKRPRTDDHPPADNILTRSPDVWYDDGNLIVIAESTMFKVYMGRLSQSSSIFCDMFCVSTSSGGDHIDGCPAVHLPDSAEDVTHMLRAIHDWQYYPQSEIQSFSAVRAFLRLGKKYDIPFLWNEASRRLRAELPASLPEFDGIPEGWVHVDLLETPWGDTINLARETGLISILPCVFLFCCTRNDFMEWVDDDDGDLSSEDQVRCYRGRDRMSSYYLKSTFGWLLKDDPHPEDSYCRNGSTRCRMSKLKLFFSRATNLELICCVGSWRDSWGVGLCSECLESGEKSFADSRVECWSKLPSFFDLPPWEELKIDNAST
ncbi:hypothetical protein JAAARDRAFT_33106 [Jaapia argillacea MUCL 33604]|uniref:BTB domain-containing protein n=1 Tax=Jaapia argillacea MUCL 33604 TaxID=933084 RepID=A0A067Q064_9AGAM|nr:hypothetical protein JAAARDRAFT_33106 [Jaapia argillacea MUCL 33604]